MPSARFYDESTYGFTLYDGTPDQKITMSSSPYDWLEASFFYTNIQDKKYCNNPLDSVCNQDYKDKGFNFKLRLKQEGVFPAVAIGLNDIGGTGFYSSEYIVASYGINNTDFHMGLGWGTLNGGKKTLKNPLGYIYDGFYDRPNEFEDRGGQFQASRYFSGKSVSPFFGFSHALNKKIIIKAEYDSTLTSGIIKYKEAKNDFSFGIEFNLTNNLLIGFNSERGSYNSIKFLYKNNPKQSKKSYEYKKAKYKESDDKYKKLRKNLEKNDIGVNKIVESDNKIGIELTQFMHPNIEIVDEIINFAKNDAGIDKEIETELKIANLSALNSINNETINKGNVVYVKNNKRKLNTNTFINFRPYLAAREGFFKGALLIENNSEFIINDGFFFSTNLKYSIVDNFNNLNIPPEDTYPAQVRSDVKDYLKNFNNGIIIGRAQFDYYLTPTKNNHLMFTGGILEEMFNGFGMEYLHFATNKNYAYGFELFKVRKRDHEMRFKMQNYENITGSINFYYRNYDFIPFDAKVSYGEYLAGDEGFTIDLSRSFLNGTKFGIFATFTDVSANDFGEGSFDKGIYFNIPIYGNFINYSWRPLTKDPGAKLIRKNTLYDLLVKFKPFNY